MTFSSYLRFSMFHLCAVFCLAAISVTACGQSQHSNLLIELNACDRGLQVFENGTVVEFRHSKKTERQLSESRMRKLRQVISRIPCGKEWQTTPQPAAALNGESRVLASTNLHNDDCLAGWLSNGAGLDEVKVTVHYPDRQLGPFPVYIICDGENERTKKWAMRTYQTSLKRNWQRFLADVSRAVGGKSILKGCHCTRGNSGYLLPNRIIKPDSHSASLFSFKSISRRLIRELSFFASEGGKLTEAQA